MKIMMNAALDELTDEQRQRVQAVSEENQIVVARTREEQLVQAPDVDIIFGSFNRFLFDAAKQLKWVQTESAGIDTILFDEFVASAIVLTSAKGTVGTHLADHSWALLLGLLRGIGRAVRERTWENRMSIRSETWELEGKTLGIIGLGGTGVEVARRAAGFGMEVIAIDLEEVPRPEFVREVWKPDRFYDLLEQSDAVSVCCPLTGQTRDLFDREAFRRMRPHSLLVNVTRGPIIDTEALLEALNQGLIRGAGLDVTPEEPLHADSPLWDHPHAIYAPRLGRFAHPTGPVHRPVLREPAPLYRWPAAPERHRQTKGLLRKRWIPFEGRRPLLGAS